MPKRREPPPEPREESLFGDLSITGSGERRETVEVPPGDSLEKILADVKASQFCGACKPGMPIVFGMGPPRADLMIIGEGPGIDDIPSGMPFQGPAGQLLTRMLAAIGVGQAECYICNVIKCVPPGERNFPAEEVEDCRPLLLRQVLAVGPRAIIAFGALAAQTLLRSKKPISGLRGQLYTLRLNDREIAVIPSFNPAYLLPGRAPEKKREAWEDLKLARDFLSK